MGLQHKTSLSFLIALALGSAAEAVSLDTIQLVGDLEGYSAVRYPDPAGGPDTIGKGYTGGFGCGPAVADVDGQDAEMIEQLFLCDLAKAEEAVLRHVTVELNPNELAALTSFVFNVGESTFKRSSVVRLLNEDKRLEAGDALLLYIYANGQRLRGLEQRRQREREIFLARH